MSRIASTLMMVVLSLCSIGIRASNAATLSTPFVSVASNQLIGCYVTNRGTTPMTVSISFTDAVGAPAAPFASDGCLDGTLAPGVTCNRFVNAGVGAFCTVEGSSAKMRAAINVLDNANALVEVVPATKK